MSPPAERLRRQLDALAGWASSLDDAERRAPTHLRGVDVERLLEFALARGDRLGGEASALAHVEVGLMSELDALAVALPTNAPPLAPDCVAGAVRTTLRTLAQRSPGRLVEVRVPPWGAVQVGVPGVESVHRRGTPPNVVECDPRTWLRLADGSLSWGEAVRGHAVSASGGHAQLGDLLPLA